PSATVKPAACSCDEAASYDWPDTSGTVVSTPLTSSALGVVKSVGGSHCWMTCMASPHIGPAVVEPCAAKISCPPTVWPLRVIQWPGLLAPAIIEAVARWGV